MEIDPAAVQSIANSLRWLVVLVGLVLICLLIITASMIYNFAISRSSHGGAKAQAAYRKASLMLQEEKPEAAVELMKKRIASHPRDPVGHWLLGQAYHRLGRHDDCRATMRKVVELDPSWHEKTKPFLEPAG